MLKGTSVLLLTNVMIFLIYISQVASYEIKVLHIKSRKVKINLGLPTQNVAIISIEGYIAEFSLEGMGNNSFPKLLKTSQGLGYEVSTSKYFGVSYDNKIYYISTNQNLNVVKHDVNKGAKEFRDIQDSKILISHVGGKVKGIQVGNFY